MSSSDARRLVAERGLARRAFEHLTVDAFLSLPFEALGPTKALLKRYFSLEPWTDADNDALAAAVGPGEGSWERALDDDVTLAYGWRDGRFWISARSRLSGVSPSPQPAVSAVDPTDPMDRTIAELTPNPRTIRFRTGPLHEGPSRWYDSPAKAAGDLAVQRLFAASGEVVNVLVGPDFVAVSLRRAADWEHLLEPILAVVDEEFAAGAGDVEGEHEHGRGFGGDGGARGRRRSTRLDEAWQELGSLRPADPRDLAVVQEAARHGDPFRRQVAANLLGEADEAAAAAEWARLVVDPSRAVRRATVDAMVDAGREGLRPLLERGLHDTDAWVRWKALRGLGELGAAPSRQAIARCATDDDFRVRMEAAAALRDAGADTDEVRKLADPSAEEQP